MPGRRLTEPPGACVFHSQAWCPVYAWSPLPLCLPVCPPSPPPPRRRHSPQVVFEIPLFYVSDWLLARYSGRTLLLTGTFCYVTRVVVYTLVGPAHPARVLAVEPLHGVTYALVQMASVREVARRAPPRLAATAQSVLAVAANVGTIAGTAGGGAVMQRWGAVVAYRGAAAAVTAAAAVYAVLTLRWEAGGGGADDGHAPGGGGPPARAAATELTPVGD